MCHYLVKMYWSIQDGRLHYMMFGVTICENKTMFMSFQSILNTGVCFVSHVGTMKFTDISDVFFEYNHISTVNLKDSFFGIGLKCHYAKSFNLETCSPTLCLIIATIVEIILHKMTICAS